MGTLTALGYKCIKPLAVRVVESEHSITFCCLFISFNRWKCQETKVIELKSSHQTFLSLSSSSNTILSFHKATKSPGISQEYYILFSISLQIQINAIVC